MSAMEDSKKVLQTSKVIEMLQEAIDLLKTELEIASCARDDYRRKLENQTKRNDLFVEQLANVKHENDMVQALLKRKERRVLELEEQYNDLSSKADSMTMTNKHLESKCNALEQLQMLQASEYGKLKISYDAIVAGQAEYREHYSREVANLKSELESFKNNSVSQYTQLSQDIVERSKDADALLEGMKTKSRGIHSLYMNKIVLAVNLLEKLARATELHGEESKQTLQDCYTTLEQLLKDRPEIDTQLHNPSTVDIDQIMADARQTLEEPLVSDDILADALDDIEVPETRRHSSQSTDVKSAGDQNKTGSSPALTQSVAPTMSRASLISWKRKKGRGGRSQSAADKENEPRASQTKWVAPKSQNGQRSRTISPITGQSPLVTSNPGFSTYQVPYQMQQYSPHDMNQQYPSMSPHSGVPQYVFSGQADNLAHPQYYSPQHGYQYQQHPIQQLPFAPDSYSFGQGPAASNSNANNKRNNRRSRIMSDDTHSRRQSQHFDMDTRRHSQHFENTDTRNHSQHF